MTHCVRCTYGLGCGNEDAPEWYYELQDYVGPYDTIFDFCPWCGRNLKKGVPEMIYLLRPISKLGSEELSNFIEDKQYPGRYPFGHPWKEIGLGDKKIVRGRDFTIKRITNLPLQSSEKEIKK